LESKLSIFNIVLGRDFDLNSNSYIDSYAEKTC